MEENYPKPEATNPIKSVETAFEVFDAVHWLNVEHEERPTLRDVADWVDLPMSTAHKHLSTLESVGLVLKEDGHYRIGLIALDFGGYERSQQRLFKHGMGEVNNLAEQTGELANIMVEEYGHGVLIYLAPGSDAVLFQKHIGKRSDLHSTALGKAILAHLPDERVEAIMDQYGLGEFTENTLTQPDELWEELERIRERGYALDDQEQLHGLRCVAAPIVVEDELLGSIGVSGPISRVKGDVFREELPELVTESATLIEIETLYE